MLPGISVVERLCAGVLVAAERRIETRISAQPDTVKRTRLENLLGEGVEGRTSRFIWLRRFEVGPSALFPTGWRE